MKTSDIIILGFFYFLLGVIIAFIGNEGKSNEYKAFITVCYPIALLCWVIKGALLFFKSLIK